MARFRLVYSESVRDKLKAVVDRLEAPADLERLRKSLQLMESRLQSDPTIWGDPAYRLHEWQLDVHHALTEAFVVYFAVDASRQIVYAKDFIFFV